MSCQTPRSPNQALDEGVNALTLESHPARSEANEGVEGWVPASRILIFIPCWAKAKARDKPAIPAPATTTSARSKDPISGLPHAQDPYLFRYHAGQYFGVKVQENPNSQALHLAEDSVKSLEIEKASQENLWRELSLAGP